MLLSASNEANRRAPFPALSQTADRVVWLIFISSTGFLVHAGLVLLLLSRFWEAPFPPYLSILAFACLGLPFLTLVAVWRRGFRLLERPRVRRSRGGSRKTQISLLEELLAHEVGSTEDAWREQKPEMIKVAERLAMLYRSVLSSALYHALAISASFVALLLMSVSLLTK